MIVPEFDKVASARESVVEDVLMPAETQFRFHLITIQNRTIPSEFVA